METKSLTLGVGRVMAAIGRPIKKVIILGAGSVQLVQTDKKSSALYHDAPEMIRELYNAGYQVVVLANNSDIALSHTRALLAAESLSCVKVYGYAEINLHIPEPDIFLHVCREEQVNPEECWFIDNNEENRQAARSLGMSVIVFDQSEKLDQKARVVNLCRDAFSVANRKVLRYQFSDHRYVEVDELNEDGNQRKRCLYQSRLSRLIIENGRQYWQSGYQEINRLFLEDFDLKSDAERIASYKTYFDKIESTLKYEGLIADKLSCNIQKLRSVLNKLFTDDFNLTQVSQFYFNLWSFDYGHEPLEPFVFLTDLMKKRHHFINDSSWSTTQPIRLLQPFPDMANNIEHRRQAYYVAQPWLTCGPPQLRGRQLRFDASTQANANTFGIIRDDDPCAADFSSPSHFSAKIFYSPSREHPIAKEFQSNGSPVVGGSSGAFGRNILMLAPLTQVGLLSQGQLNKYVMGFLADLIYRGHHSYEEVAIVSEQILSSRKPWIDSLRDPISFYEQLLTDEFIASNPYRQFLTDHRYFFT